MPPGTPRAFSWDGWVIRAVSTDVESALFFLVPQFLTANRIHFAENCSSLAQRLRRRLEPVPGVVVEVRAQGLAHPGVVPVEPGDLVRRHQRGLDQPALDRGEGQGLETEHVPLAAGDRARLDQ